MAQQQDGSRARLLDASEARSTRQGAEIMSQGGGILDGINKMADQLALLMQDDSAAAAGSSRPNSLQAQQALLRVKMCFVLDCTGSMRAEIDSVKAKFAETLRECFARFGRKLDIKIAFVGYRDIGDREQTIVMPFTSSETEATDFLRHLVPVGGEDEAEDVIGGLQAVLLLDWADEDVKLIFHCCDAPPHGRDLHDGAGDRFPDGIRGQRAWQEVIEELAHRHIDYYLAQVPDPRGHISTNKMARRFGEVYDGTGTYCNPFTVLANMERYTPDTLFTHVMASLSTSLVKGFSALMSKQSFLDKVKEHKEARRR